MPIWQPFWPSDHKSGRPVLIRKRLPGPVPGEFQYVIVMWAEEIEAFITSEGRVFDRWLLSGSEFCEIPKNPS